MLRTKEALIPYLLWVAVVAAGLLWHESQMLPALGRSVITGKMAIGGPYALTDQDGKPRAIGDFRGRYQLVYFGYTFCPDVCPTTLALMAAALDKMGSQQNRIVPIFITVDPDRDKPQVLKKYLAAFGPRFVGLTGTAQEIAQVEKEYHVYAKNQPLQNGNYSITHSSVIYLLGPDGHLAAFFNDIASPDDLAKALEDKAR